MIAEVWGGPKDGEEIEIHAEDLDADQLQLSDTWYVLNRDTGRLEIVK